jgi:hypothetical protein
MHVPRLSRALGSRSRGRLLTRIVAASAASSLAVFGLVASSSPASATVSTDAGFEFNDGNLVHNTVTDWNDFAPTTWTGTAPYRTTTKIASGWALTGLEDAQKTGSDTAFAGGVKQDDDCATVTGASAPNKDDLKRVYVTTKTVNGEVFLGLAWVRIPQNTTSPSAHIGFEFNQGTTPCPAGSDGLVRRTAGDMLIVYDFEGGSTDSPTITLRRWLTDPTDPDQGSFFTDAAHPCDVDNDSPPCWGDAKNLSALGFAEARVNTSTVGTVVDANTPPTAPATQSVSSTLGLNEFGEAGINLTDAGVFSPGICTAFGKTYAVSRSSGNSGTAQMKDLVGPGNISINNCGALSIVKNSAKGGAVATAGAVFSYDGHSVTDNGAGDEDPAVGSVCVSGLEGGDYTVTETSAPPGYGLPVVTTGTATVVVGTNCTTNLPTGAAVVTFTDPPLSDIQVNFRDGGSGETSAVITCDNTTGTGSDTPATGWDTSRTVTGIEGATTVHCTIVIDP